MYRTNNTTTVARLLYFVFFLSGIATVLIGMVLPHLSARFALNDQELGYYFPAQFSGSLLGTLLTNWFGKSSRLKMATWLGSFLMAAGIMLMNSAVFPASLAAFFINGIGVGLTLPAVNLQVIRMNPVAPAAALNSLNFFWGAGAILAKPIVDLSSGSGSIFWTTVILAFPLAAGGIAIAMIGPAAPIESEFTEDPADEPHSSIWRQHLAWMIASFNFLHVGFESGMGGWITTYANRLAGAPVEGVLSPTFLFFLFFVSGRAIAPLAFRFVGENTALFTGLGVMIAGSAVLLSAETTFMLGVGAAVVGLGTSSVFPTNVSRFYKTFGERAMKQATPLFLCGTFGAAALTYLIGFLSERAGDLRSGMKVLGLCVVLLLAIQVYIALQTRSGIKRADARARPEI